MSTTGPEWEVIQSLENDCVTQWTSRLPIDGGWLYKHRVRTGATIRETMVFVPDARRPNPKYDNLYCVGCKVENREHKYEQRVSHDRDELRCPGCHNTIRIECES